MVTAPQAASGAAARATCPWSQDPGGQGCQRLQVFSGNAARTQALPRHHQAPHLLLRNLSAASAGACPPGPPRGRQSPCWGSPLGSHATRHRSVSTRAETRAPPAPRGWRKRRRRCCRATCWPRPWRSASAPRWTAGRPRASPRPRPRPRPGGRPPPSGLRKMAADSPGHTPRFGRLGSRGRVPVRALWLPTENGEAGRGLRGHPRSLSLAGHAPPGEGRGRSGANGR